ncbi:MAG TPA: RNA polymerase sigma factor [Acidimicrobiales bacterium]|nr:RNA polymerase sigma factor [Acidimicrobiales bacterium]
MTAGRGRAHADRADPELVAAAQAGDRTALDELLGRHYDRLHALCRRMTGDEQDALDATQEALIAIVRGLPRYDGRAAFTTWAYRVTTNACLDELRRRGRRPRPVAPDDTSAPLGPGDVGAPSLDQSSVDRLSIDAALRELSPEFRAAVVLRDQLGLDYAEIAEVLDLPPGTVRSRIARGRRALATILERNPAGAGTVEETTP